MEQIKRNKNITNKSEQLVKLANGAIEAFKKEDLGLYSEFIREYENQSLDVVITNYGIFHFSIENGKPVLTPGHLKGSGTPVHVTVSPETLIRLIEEDITPINAYFRGLIGVKANSNIMHTSYNFLFEFMDVFKRSKTLQQYIEDFKAL